jgi:hypothetical protein
MRDAEVKMAEAFRDDLDIEKVVNLAASLLANGYDMAKVRSAVKRARTKAAKHP